VENDLRKRLGTIDYENDTEISLRKLTAVVLYLRPFLYFQTYQPFLSLRLFHPVSSKDEEPEVDHVLCV